MRMPIGEEWNASHVVKGMTKPAIKRRAGRIIEPITLPKKRSHASSGGNSKSEETKQDKKQKIRRVS